MNGMDQESSSSAYSIVKFMINIKTYQSKLLWRVNKNLSS